MTKTDVNKIEKQFLKDTAANVQAWAEDKFVGGGVEIDKDFAKVAEDFKHIDALNALTRLVTKSKLNDIQKSLTFNSTFGYHNAASDTLAQAAQKLLKLAK